MKLHCLSLSPWATCFPLFLSILAPSPPSLALSPALAPYSAPWSAQLFQFWVEWSRQEPKHAQSAYGCHLVITIYFPNNTGQRTRVHGGALTHQHDPSLPQVTKPSTQFCFVNSQWALLELPSLDIRSLGFLFFPLKRIFSNHGHFSQLQLWSKIGKLIWVGFSTLDILFRDLFYFY